MPGIRRSGPDLGTVVAARGGDQRALEQLVAQCLPLVYNIVGRALNGHQDVDDVVQETLLRALRGLSELRDPKAFRSWLVAIAVRQIRERERQRATAYQRSADLDTAEQIPDPALDFAGLTILRLGLTDQRRGVAEATRWLDGDDQALLSLWWLEETGELDRAELAAALGLSGRHAAVRVQRMKEQMDTARVVVRALTTASACAELQALTANWDGRPSPLWRKRFARHIRGCATCDGLDEGLLPMDRLLSGLPLLPVPFGIHAGGLAGAASPYSGEAAAQPLQHATRPTGQTAPTQHTTAGPAPRRATGRGNRHKASHAGHARRSGRLMSMRRGPVIGSAAAAVVSAAVAAALVANHLSTGPSTTSAAPTRVSRGPVAAPTSGPTLPVHSAEPSPSLSPSPSSLSPTPASDTPSKKAPKPPPTHKSPAAPPPAAKIASSSKKGVGVWSFSGVSSALAESGASWYYTWSTQHQGITTPAAGNFVPMIWGPGSVTPGALAQAKAEGPYLLGFNEPDNSGQSNMTVDQALDLWPQLMSTGKILGSPAVAAGGDVAGGWLDRFMAGAAAKHYRVDFITLHWYGGDFDTQDAVEQLKSYLQAVYLRYHKPIWLTEYALIDFSHGTRYASPEQEAAFVTASTEMLADLPYLQRYAWFGLPAKESGPSTGLFRSGPVATDAGRAFEEARLRATAAGVRQAVVLQAALRAAGPQDELRRADRPFCRPLPTVIRWPVGGTPGAAAVGHRLVIR